MAEDYTKRRIVWVEDGFVGITDKSPAPEFIHGCEGCIFSNDINSCNKIRAAKCAISVLRPINEFPPERLAKFRLTGEDDG